MAYNFTRIERIGEKVMRTSANHSEVTFLENSDVDRIKSMAKESAIQFMATMLNVDYNSAEKLYNLIFTK